MAWLSIQAPKIAICHCLSPLNHASLNSDFIEGHFFATDQSPAAICVSEPHLQRGQRGYRRTFLRAVAAILWPEVGNLCANRTRISCHH